MYSKLIAFGSALLLAGVLSSAAPAQESAAEKQREQQMDTAAAGNAYKEPLMAAALSHLRQAEEELEKANNEHGPPATGSETRPASRAERSRRNPVVQRQRAQ